MNELKITAIERQKKRKNRYSIFLNDEFAFGVDAAVLAEACWQEGDCLTQDQIDDLLQREEKRRVRESAFRYLARRAHSEKELRDKLVRKGFVAILIEQVVTELKQKRFLDDAEFALSYARNRIIRGAVGERVLRQELWRKGVAEELVTKVIGEVYAERSQLDLARELAKKRSQRHPNLARRELRKKLSDFLLRRGFDWEIVQDVIEEHFKAA